MIDNDHALGILQDFEEAVSKRSTRDAVWQDIRELVRPSTSDFTGSTVSGDVRTHNAYDATAIDACKELAAGLHSYLTNPAERWFSLGITGFGPQDYDEDALAWLENVADVIFMEHSRPASGFHVALHECYLDIAAFGTSCPYQAYSLSKKCLTFRSFPIADVFFKEDVDGHIDTVYRRVVWTRRQIAQQFEKLPEKIRDEKRMEKEYVVVHAVFPRKDRKLRNSLKQNKPFASVWVCKDTKELIEESGYDTFCYHPARWEKLAGEVYGEGPASTCLPDILMLNAMERTIIRAGQKQTDPPLMIPNDGYTLPLSSAPGSVLWKEPGAEEIIALEFKGNLPWAEEKCAQKRLSIQKCFHSDWLRMEKENKEMTAFEVSDRRNEKLGLLAPNLGRIQGEKLGPLVARSYQLLHEHNRFPQSPESLRGKRLKVEYTSPAARAQFAVKANEASRYVQEMMAIGAVKPEVLDFIDFDLFAKKLAEYRSITRTILKSSDEVQAQRQQRQQQEQMAQMMQMAEPATKAVKNIADAQSKGLNLGL